MKASRVEPEHILPLPCLENTHAMPSIDDLQDSFYNYEYNENLFICEVPYPDIIEQKPGSVSTELECTNAKGEVFDPKDEDEIVDLSPEPPQDSVLTQLRKRTYTSKEDCSQHKRLKSSPISGINPEIESPMIFKNCLRSPRKCSQKILKGSGAKTDILGEKVNSPEVTFVEPNTVLSTSARFISDDGDKRNIGFEYQQYIALLKRYGVLNVPEFYTSQKHPVCAPHPGYVGDGQLSKQCKMCRAPEDASNTIICDECQEVFHLSCCLPRVSSKYFHREDDWFCSSCRKRRRRTGSVHYFKLSENGFADNFVYFLESHFISRVRLGPAHQADIPSWTGKVEDVQISCTIGRPGTEVPLPQEAKDHEKERILNTFRSKVAAVNWTPAKNLLPGTPENWLKCQNVLVKAYRDSNGHKHNDVICGKWRRAPSHIQQSDHWECFCVIDWDPVHADCAVPQELPTEKILKRMQTRTENHKGGENTKGGKMSGSEEWRNCAQSSARQEGYIVRKGKSSRKKVKRCHQSHSPHLSIDADNKGSISSMFIMMKRIMF